MMKFNYSGICDRIWYSRPLERIRDWRAIREYYRSGWQTELRHFEKPQKIRLVRKGNLGEGDLWHGRCQDGGQFKGGIWVHVGNEPLPLSVPDKVFAFRYTINDGTNSVKALKDVAKIADVAVEAIRSGCDVYWSCDMGMSRSVASIGLLISLLSDVPMDDNLRRVCANPAYADWKEFGLGNPVVWQEFKLVREFVAGGGEEKMDIVSEAGY